MMEATNRNQILFVADLVRQVFGVNSPVYVPYGQDRVWSAGNYPDINFLPEDTVLETIPQSEFGTNVFGTITFERGNYNAYDRAGKAIRQRFGEYTLPYSCITSFRRPSNIVKTEVLGSSGTVKEIYGKGDWEITIRGAAFNRRDGTGVSAHEVINTLSKWAEVCDAIGVSGSVFGGKGIDAIVINEFSVQPVVGQWDAIPFQIDAISDEAIELYL